VSNYTRVEVESGCRAAIYARYSSDLQSADSIADQVRLCRARIERENWTLVATYRDQALSGATRLRDFVAAIRAVVAARAEAS
jgi:site-specific DNA recombinase